MTIVEDSGFLISANYRRMMPKSAPVYELRAFEQGLMYGPLTEAAMKLHNQTLRQLSAVNTERVQDVRLNPDLLHALTTLAIHDKPHYPLQEGDV